MAIKLLSIAKLPLEYKDAGKAADSANLDLTALLGAVSTGSTMFNWAYVSNN